MNGLSARARSAVERRARPAPCRCRSRPDQHGRAARRGARDQVVDRPHLRAAADDLVEPVRARLPLSQLAVFAHQPAPLDGVAQDGQHFVVLERLRKVVERAQLGRRDGVSIVPNAVIITTGSSSSQRRMSSSTSRPLRSGSIRSSRTVSNSSARQRVEPCCAVAAVATR